MKKYRVLLVDDEVTIREGFKKLFPWEEHGCEIIDEAGDGLSAVNIILEKKPDIVLMDINIPFLGGLEVIRRTKKDCPGTAFIIVSGYDDFTYCREALRLKVEEYLLKPVDFSEFAAVLDNLKITMFRKHMEQDTEKDSRQLKQIYSITNYIQEHLKEEISLKIIAEQFHLNDNYISQLFKNEIGVNYLAYLTSLRIERAKTLLLGSQKTLTEVADEVGFRDYRTFIKAFKKQEKVTPSQYRREY